MQNIFMSVNVRTNSFCPNSSFTQMYKHLIKWLENFDVDKPLRILKYFHFYWLHLQYVCMVGWCHFISKIGKHGRFSLHSICYWRYFSSKMDTHLIYRYSFVTCHHCHPTSSYTDFFSIFFTYFITKMSLIPFSTDIFHLQIPPFVTTAFCLIMLTIWSFLVELCDISPCVCQYILLHDIFTMNTRRIALNPL